MRYSATAALREEERDEEEGGCVGKGEVAVAL